MKKLEVNQMENLDGGLTRQACNDMANGLGGSALIFGAASWWTGAGAGFALALGAGSYAFSLYCQTL